MAAAAAAVGNPNAAAAAASVSASRVGAGALRAGGLRVAAGGSVARRGGAVVAAAMRPAKAVASPAKEAAGEVNGAAPGGFARPDAFGRFGKFGGKYVPETLMHALTELEAAFHALAGDEDFQVTAHRAGSPLRFSGFGARLFDSRSIFRLGFIFFNPLGKLHHFISSPNWLIVGDVDLQDLVRIFCFFLRINGDCFDCILIVCFFFVCGLTLVMRDTLCVRDLWFVVEGRSHINLQNQSSFETD